MNLSTPNQKASRDAKTSNINSQSNFSRYLDLQSVASGTKTKIGIMILF